MPNYFHSHLTTEEREETEDQNAPGKPSEGGAVPGQQDCDGGQSGLSGYGCQNSAGSLHTEGLGTRGGTETFHCDDYSCNRVKHFTGGYCGCY